MGYIKWTPEEESKLVEMMDEFSVKEIAEYFGKKYKCVASKISRMQESGKCGKKKRIGKLSHSMAEYLIANYHKMTVVDLAKEMGVDKGTVYNWAMKLDLAEVEEVEFKTPVFISYVDGGKTRVRQSPLIVNEKNYKKACERAVDIATRVGKLKDVRVVEQ